MFELREAWNVEIRRAPARPEHWTDGPDLPAEVSQYKQNHPRPLVLIVWIPLTTPAPWRAIVCNRLVSTLGPQLDAGGFLSRPLCHDSPFAFLLWPRDAT